jgi:5-(carboxyamino)imidazole ribonucleotide mutase
MSLYLTTVNGRTMRGSSCLDTSSSCGPYRIKRPFLCKIPRSIAFSQKSREQLIWVFFYYRGLVTLREVPVTIMISVIMGSTSDWETMKHACDVLEELEIPFEKQVVSAHRTPDYMFEFAEGARARGVKVIIAGAGGAAHLPGMVAAKTTLPVIGVPVQSKALNGMDSLLSIVQMPGGVPVATVAIGKAGATNAGLLAAQILSIEDTELAATLENRRDVLREKVMESSDDLE